MSQDGIEGPAFPINEEHLAGEIVKNGQSPEGMSKRFYAACKAMNGMLSSLQGMAISEMKEELIKRSYEFADEMLKQEDQ